MIRISMFGQSGRYTNQVRIYPQNGRIYELSSDINELDEIQKSA